MKRLLSLLSLSTLTIFVSCQNSANQKDSASLNDSTSYTGLTGDSVKLVKTAAVDFKVKDVEQSTRAVSSLAKSYGGMIFHQSMEAVEAGKKELKLSPDSLLVVTASTPHASIALRVPSANLEAFMYDVAALGYYTGSSQLSVDDKSLAYLQNALKQRARTEVLSQPVVKNNGASKVTTIAIKDEAIEQQMANKSIDADVAYSTVNLTLFQNAVVKKEVIANYNLSDYELPFSQRLGTAISDGWQYFLAFVLALVHLWMFILAGITAFVFYKYSQHKKRPVALPVKP